MICDRCGYAVGVLRIAVLVERRTNLDAKLCADCLNKALDAVRPEKVRR